MDSVSKVLIDVEGGNNMMYLPLDKIVSQQATKTEDSQLSNSDLVGQVANEVINRLRTDQSRSKAHGGKIMNTRLPIFVLLLAIAVFFFKCGLSCS